MNKDIINYNTSEALPHPYVSWRDYFKFNPGNDLSDLFNACCTLSSKKSKENVQTSPSFTDIRKLVTVLFSQRVQEMGFKISDISSRTGTDVTYLSKFNRSGTVSNPYRFSACPSGEKVLSVNGDVRPFSLPIPLLPGFCTEVFGTTCHEVFFGERRRIVLPKLLRIIAKQIYTLSDKEIIMFTEWGLRLRDDAILKHDVNDFRIPNNEGKSEYGQYRPEHIVIRERLREISREMQDINRAKYVFFTDDMSAPSKFKVAWNGIFTGELASYRTENRKIDSEQNQYLPNLEIPMFMALASILDSQIPDKNLDYFICNDYIQVKDGASPKVIYKNRSPIFTYDDKGYLQEIEDEDVLRILSFCIALPDNVKTAYIGRILSSIR